MANHIRQQIREQVATTLTGLTTTGSNVFQSRVYHLQDSNLPALLIYTATESSEAVTIGTTRNIERILELNIEGYAKATTNSDDTVDTIAKEVEVALASDVTINGLAKDCFIESTEISYNGEGEQPLAVIKMIFAVHYITAEGTPDTAI
tara:strand:- start:2302 stop:2748 length:447 start_codon:yes stop_codon:yes gene_type:complete